MGERPTELTVRLLAAAEYRLGLPFFVEITLANETEGAEYYNLATCDPWSPPFPVELTFTATEADTGVTLPAQSPARGEAQPRGFDLSPGQARTFVLDLSELQPVLQPGRWQCQARWAMRHENPRSKLVAITLAAPDPADLPLLAHLQHAGGAREPHWANLIKSPTALEGNALRGLSERASRALVPYLILHQAVHGPEPLAVFPLEFLAPHRQGGPWASEASVLAYELVWARRAPDLAEDKRRLLQRWPGLAFRIDEIEAGAGLLTTLRREHGPDGKNA